MVAVKGGQQVELVVGRQLAEQRGVPTAHLQHASAKSDDLCSAGHRGSRDTFPSLRELCIPTDAGPTSQGNQIRDGLRQAVGQSASSVSHHSVLLPLDPSPVV